MRLLIHAANLPSGGGLAVAASLVRSWLDGPGDTIAVLASPALATLLPMAPAGCVTVISPSPTASVGSLRRFRQQANEIEHAFRPDAVLTVFGPPLWRPEAPHLCGFANGLYLWSLPEAAGSAPLLHRLKMRLRRWQVFASLRRDTDALWVETEFAAKTLAARLGVSKPISVVPNALHPSFETYRHSAVPPPSSVSPLRLFSPAAGYPHKNFRLIRNLLPLFGPDEVEFHLTLPRVDFERYFAHLHAHPALINHGPVAPEILPGHYLQAHAVFTPSFLEIASAAWNEAAAMRRPVLSADIPAARQACGDGALYFDPTDVSGAAQCIRRLREDADLRQCLAGAAGRRLPAIPSSADRVTRLRNLLLALCASSTASTPDS